MLLTKGIHFKIYYLFILLILLPFIVFGKNYEVSFLGAHVVNVEITENKLVNNSIKILYHTKTNKYVSLLYDVDNYYEVVLDSDYKTILSYKKNIAQKDISQHYEAYFKNDSVYYSNGIKKKCKSPVQNILGLIFQLREINKDVRNLHIEHEGNFYKANVKIVPEETNTYQTTYRIYTKKISGENVLEKTDIYSWKIADSSAVKKIIYSNIDSSIVGAEFKFGKYKLSAKEVK